MRPVHVALAVSICILAPLFWMLQPSKPKGDHIPDFRGWGPTASEIKQEVDRLPISTGERRDQLFIQRFKQRFREKRIAVSLRWESGSKLRILCAAAIPRWDMARLASAAVNEARSILGRQIEADLYETYISIPSRKMAELRWDKRLNKLRVDFRENYPRTYSYPMREEARSK